MTQEFSINFKFPSLNEYINEARASRYISATSKKNCDWVVRLSIVKARLKPTCKPLKVHFEWHEKTRRRDLDNIAFAKKFIFDGLVKQKIIPNDSYKYVKGFTDDFVFDHKQGCRVILEEIEREQE